VDSVVLLQALHELAPEFGWRLAVAHFNHQLRGRSSDADERFVAAVAKKFKLPFHVGRADVKAQAEKTGASIEMAARELRHKFLTQTARRLKYDAVALAHHADDQVELFFLRVLRGSGGRGLAGMKWRAASPADERIQLVRPLLDVSRKDIEEFAQANGLRFRTDASNASCDPLRNRIRHELLPLLRQRFQPAVERTVLRLAEIVGAEAATVEAQAEGWLRRKSGPFEKLPVAVQRAVVQSQLHSHKFVADFDLVETLRRSPNERVMVASGIQVARDAKGKLLVTRVAQSKFLGRKKAATLRGEVGTIAFGERLINWRVMAQRGARLPARTPNHEVFDAQKVGKRIILRHWQPGDRFQPIGMNSAVKLQDWFVNQGVPRERRRQLLVATTVGGEIFWVEKQRISEQFKLGEGTTRGLHWHWKCV
jgi:tRNA(Ile)-lysidine synthase